MNNTSQQTRENFLDIHSRPFDISKASVLEPLLASGVLQTIPLKTAQLQNTGITLIRSALDSEFADKPSVCEFDCRILESLLPETVHQWPGCYIRLPSEWAADVAHMLASENFYSFIQRSNEDPWHIGQYVALDGRPLQGAWPHNARRIVIEDTDLNFTLNRGIESGAVVVLIECNEQLSITAFPVGDELILSLQMGDSASCRHPLYDLSLAAVQSLVRDVEDRATCPKNPNVLRLPVISICAKPEIHFKTYTPHPMTKIIDDRQPVRVSGCGAGAVGTLPSLVGHLPPDFMVDDSLVLRLTIPSKLYEKFQFQPPKVTAMVLSAEGAVAGQVAVVLTSGEAVFVAKLFCDDEQVRAGIAQFSESGLCQVVVENNNNGRWNILNIPFPKGVVLSNPRTQLESSASHLKKLELHPAIFHLACDIGERLDETVQLMHCDVSGSKDCTHHQSFSDMRMAVSAVMATQ